MRRMPKLSHKLLSLNGPRLGWVQTKYWAKCMTEPPWCQANMVEHRNSFRRNWREKYYLSNMFQSSAPFGGGAGNVTDFISVCNLLYKFIRKPAVAVHYKGETLKRLLDQHWTGHLATEQWVTWGHFPPPSQCEWKWWGCCTQSQIPASYLLCFWLTRFRRFLNHLMDCYSQKTWISTQLSNW